METRDMNLELYVAPEVKLLEVVVEAGFAGSGFGENEQVGGYPGGGEPL